MRSIRLVCVFLFALVVLSMGGAAFAQVAVSITFGPPALPIYEQPPCPEEGYIWTPGYWAFDYDYNDYYWVPGTWVAAPEVGLFWTPGYWAWERERFFFHEGYWGPQVGFYGGISYGFGYFGEGYQGGRWDNGRFFYNRSVNNVNITVIHNVYNTTVINNTTVNRVSYNGGNGGINARPTQRDEQAARERHIQPVAVQTRHVQEARGDRDLRASVNQGKPPIAATPKPAEFRERGVVGAREAGAPYKREANPNRGAEPSGSAAAQRPENPRPDNNPRPGNATHAKDLAPTSRPDRPNTGNPKRDQQYEQQQEKLQAKQQQERQKLEQKQDKDHQQLEQRKADETRRQQTEQRHQQQTQHLEEKHNQQQQKLQQREQPERKNQPKPPNEGHPHN